MALDLDYITGEQSIDKLKDMLARKDHGYREEMADMIISFVEMMEERYPETVKE